jgi:hypothetical protein
MGNSVTPHYVAQSAPITTLKVSSSLLLPVEFGLDSSSERGRDRVQASNWYQSNSFKRLDLLPHRVSAM